MTAFDVAVVGAGPAGATAARALAAAGVRTALLERRRLPRYKTCAGGIPLRTRAALPFPIDAAVEDEVTTIAVSYRGSPRFEQACAQPFACMVMRDRFDHLLAGEAVAAGATLVEGAAVRAVERGPSGLTLRTDRGHVQAAFVVGADGANSAIGRACGLAADLAEGCALEAEVQASRIALDRWRGAVNVDLGYEPSGYGWVFPKRHLLSVGLVLPAPLASRLRPQLGIYLERLGLRHAALDRLSGHKVRFRRGHERIAGGRVLLVGDAAGLVDEFTEEGIFYAVRSGLIAARFLQRALGGHDSWLGAYERAIDRELMPELRAARTIARLYYGSLRRTPRAMLFVSAHVRYLWDAFFRVQRGESSYHEELRRARLPAVLGRILLR